MVNDFTRQYVYERLVNAIQNNQSLLSHLKKRLKVFENKDIARSILDKFFKFPDDNPLGLYELVILYRLAQSLDSELELPHTYFEQEEIRIANKLVTNVQYDEILSLMQEKGVDVNTERKAKYIYDCYGLQDKVAIRNVINFFASKVSVNENKNNKDISEFSDEEYIQVLMGVTPQSLAIFKGYISIYLEWCIENGFAASEVLDTFKKAATIDNLRDNELFQSLYYFSEQELSNNLNTILEHLTHYENNSILQSYEHMKKLVVPCAWLSWVGFGLQDIFDIRVADVDINKRSIHCKKTNKIISDIPQHIFDEIIGETYLWNSETSILNLDGKEYSIQNFENYVKLCITKIDALRKDELPDSKKLSMKKIWYSGLFNRMLEYERQNNTIISSLQERLVAKLMYNEKASYRTTYNAIVEFEEWKRYAL